jgi:hypothetical protein
LIRDYTASSFKATMEKLKTLLIANRGEIAVRVYASAGATPDDRCTIDKG